MTKENIVNQLRDIAEREGDYALNAEGWFERIKNSNAPDEMLAEINGVPVYLVKAIKGYTEN